VVTQEPTPTPPLLPPVTPPPPAPAPAPVPPDRSSSDILGVEVSPSSRALDREVAPAPARPSAARWLVVAVVVLMTLAIAWSIARR
jgi:hypothetical protein